MFLTGNKSISVIELCKDNILTKYARKVVKDEDYGFIEFSYPKLCFAIAKTVVSRNISDVNLVLSCLSNYFSLAYIIDSSKICITLNKAHFENLRDFSQTSRIGEIGQGINYLICQELLDFKFITDFHGFLRDKGYDTSKISKKSTPDYIIQKQNDFNIALLESKASYGNSNRKGTSSTLRKALNQCDAGEKIIKDYNNRYSITNKYGLCIEISNEEELYESRCCLVDPESDQYNNSINNELAFHHYASWLALLGDVPNAIALSQNYTIKDIQRKYILQGGYYYFNSARLSDFIFYNYNNFNGYRIGIHEQVMLYLAGENEYPLNIDFNLKIDESIIYYTDGVILTRL